MTEIKALEKLREIAADINASEIVDHMELYPSCVFDGAWLDAWQADFYRTIDELESEIAERYMELPVDTDGVPIHVGDMMTLRHGKSCEVVAVSKTQFTGKKSRSENCVCHANLHRHVKPRTVEDVLRDMLNDEMTKSMFEEVCEQYIAKYADEIRELLRGDA